MGDSGVLDKSMGRKQKLYSLKFSLNYFPKDSKIHFKMRNYALLHGNRNKIEVKPRLAGMEARSYE